MQCLLWGHLQAHQHGKTPGGVQRYLCPGCHQTFHGFDRMIQKIGDFQQVLKALDR